MLIIELLLAGMLIGFLSVSVFVSLCYLNSWQKKIQANRNASQVRSINAQIEANSKSLAQASEKIKKVRQTILSYKK